VTTTPRDYLLEYIAPLLVGVISSLIATAYWSDPIRSIPISAGLLLLSIAVVFFLRKRHEHDILGKMKIYSSFTRAHHDILSSCQDSPYLHVVAIRGMHIFDGDLFADILRSVGFRRAEMKILLLDPDSDSMKHYLRHTLPLARIDDYLSEWKMLTQKLSSQRANGTNISVRTYKCAPLWKLILTSRYCFFVGYTDDKRGHSLPLIRVDNASNCFAIALERYFAELWEEGAQRELTSGDAPRDRLSPDGNRREV